MFYEDGPANQSECEADTKHSRQNYGIKLDGIPAWCRVEDPQGALFAHPRGELVAVGTLQDVASVVA